MLEIKQGVKLEPDQEYLDETVPPFTPQMALEEATRCLLCLDPPCSRDCPAGTDPGKFIRSIRFRNFKGAAETIRKNNILGGVCARVCPFDRLCESACSRTGIDKPIHIGRLQRFATDYEMATGLKVLEAPQAAKEKVAMIGSGPASLSAAANLALKGYRVTVYEEKPKAGGVLSYGIVPARLPQYVVDEEIGCIEDLGVEFIFNTKVGRDTTIEDLKAKGIKAFFLGVGLKSPMIYEIPGIDLDGVTNAVDYLAAAKPGKGKVEVGKYVVVIGGGDVAMDCATTARLLGARKVTVLYRRTREEMPADRLEVKYVESLGVNFIFTFAPEEIIGENGKVAAIKGVGTRDNSGIQLQADTIVYAIGQKPADDLAGIAAVKLTDKGLVAADENEDCKTSVPYIFAAGDIVNGGVTVVQAVAAGKVAAASIDRYLSKERAK